MEAGGVGSFTSYVLTNELVQRSHMLPMKQCPPVHKHHDGAALVLPLFQHWPEKVDLLTPTGIPHHIPSSPLLPHPHHL